MTGAELYERFVAPGVDRDDIAAMQITLLAIQIGELRRAEPDNIRARAFAIVMSDLEIAWAIQDYAAGREGGQSNCR